MYFIWKIEFKVYSYTWHIKQFNIKVMLCQIPCLASNTAHSLNEEHSMLERIALGALIGTIFFVISQVTVYISYTSLNEKQYHLKFS